MARTTAASVKAVLAPGNDYDLSSNYDLTPFIDIASAMVDDVVDCIAAKGGTALTAARLELIERWLAAHYYKCSDKSYRSRSTEGASGAFDGNTNMYLEATLYGQHAMRLDSSGCLQSAGGTSRASASGFWLGKAPSDQTDYVDRD